MWAVTVWASPKWAVARKILQKVVFYKDGIAVILLQVGLRQGGYNKWVVEVRVLEVFFAASEGATSEK